MKHQVVDWGSFSSNRWLRHFMTNRHGTIASQTVLQLLLYTTQWQLTRGALTAAHRSQGGPHRPSKAAAGAPSPVPRGALPREPTWGSGRKANACHFRQQTRETPGLEKSYKVQSRPHMLKYGIF